MLEIKEYFCPNEQCKMPYFKARLAVTILIYNCVRPHNTLSRNTDKTRTPRTPALVAGLIEKNLTIETAFKTPMVA